MIEVVTAASTSPITLADAKSHLRVLHEDDDDLIGDQLAAACDKVERATRLSLQPQTLRCSLGNWPRDDRRLWLPRPPLVSVTHVKHLDAESIERTVSSSQYALIGNGLWFNESYDWPVLAGRPDAVRVTYVAGVATITKELRNCILLLLQQSYDGIDERRQRSIDATIQAHVCRHPKIVEGSAR